MNPVPQHRALLGVDVIGSAQLPAYLMNAVPETISKLVDSALEQSGVEPNHVLSVESPGDGVLMVLPSEQLGAVLDAAVRLDQLTVDHNRWSKPEVRPRSWHGTTWVDKGAALWPGVPPRRISLPSSENRRRHPSAFTSGSIRPTPRRNAPN